MTATLDRMQRGGWVAAGIGVVGCVAVGFYDPAAFLRSYLPAYLFFVGLAVGCFSLLMLHHLTGGYWGLISRRILEAGVRTVPLFVLLFLPIAFGVRILYVWAGPTPEDHALAAAIAHKAPYLNVPFFLARAVFYFGAWSVLGYFLTTWSAELDKGPNLAVERKLRSISGGGLVLMGLTITFSSFDWAMSLDPRWSSTIYGLIFMVGQVVSAMSFVLLFLSFVADEAPFEKVARPSIVHDLGKLLFAFVMLWAYMHLSQFLITWSGNLPEEVVWYLVRLRGGWETVGLALVLLHFVLPFVLLLSRGLKRNVRLMRYVVAGLLVMRVVEVYWVVEPAFPGAEARLHASDVFSVLALGGAFAAYFAIQFRGRPPLPAADPELQALLEGA
jgi:hypothetical protein